MKTLSPELTGRTLAVLGRLIDADGLAFTSDTEAAAALSNCGWIVGIADDWSDAVVWKVSSPARALADARALLDGEWA